jgi:hypothetical protein
MEYKEKKNVMKKEMPKVLRGIDAEIAEAKKKGDVKGMKKLQTLRSQMLQTSGFNFNRLVFDLATLELPALSVDTEGLPPVKVIRNQAFLICCDEPVVGTDTGAYGKPVYDPCGCGSSYTNGSPTVAGFINWYLKVCLDTTFRFFFEPCVGDEKLPFTVTGTTCVNQELCPGANGTQVCPDPEDLCDVISIAILINLNEVDNKAIATYLIVHILPDCEEANGGL